MQEGPHPSPENKVNVDGDIRRSTVHAPPSSSRLDHLPAPGSSLEKPTVPSAKSFGCEQQNSSGNDCQNSEATAGLPSFASYLSDLESVPLFQVNSTSCSRSNDYTHRLGDKT